MVSKLILGTAQIGMNYGINNREGKIHKNDAFNILNFAFQNGIQYLDTAPVYGDAQSIIGEFHKLYPSTKFKVITKIPAGYPIEKLDKLVDCFLMEMSIDTIEVLHFHSIIDYINADFNKMSVMLNCLKESGKVQLFGVSIYENSEADSISRSLIDVIQLPFNLLDNINLRGELLEKLKEQNFTVQSRSVFLQGLFFKEIIGVDFQEIYNPMATLKQISNASGMKIEELALSYCVYQNNIDNVLIGVDSMEQLERNISILKKKINREIFGFINEINIKDNNLLNPSKWEIR